ncbi:MAG: ABC transporter permease [Holophagales bacterium]|nr:ABC transporter permease [Holophagales bacterium]
MDTLTLDLRHSLRSLRRRPLFALGIVLVLALGLGANTLIFAVVDAVVLRPLPVPEPDRLVQPWESFGWLTKEEFLAVRESSRGLRPAGFFTWPSFAVRDEGAPEIVRGSMVTREYFDVLGVRPAHGRFFSSDAEAPGAPPEAAISHRLWWERYGGDPSIVGRSLDVDGRPTTVVGVVPAGLGLPRAAADLWLPFTFDPADTTDFTSRYVQILVRLGDGTDMAAAREETRRLATLLEDRFPLGEGFAERAGGPVDLRELMVGDTRPVLLALWLAATAVMLVATVNVANLLLARGAARRRELAVRSAVGADRRRLLRLLTVEGLLLSAAGGTLGLALALASVRPVAAALPAGIPRLHEIAPDGNMLAVGGVLILCAGLLFGLLPSARLLHGDLVSSLRSGSAGGLGRSRLQGTLVIAEVALAFALLFTAGLVAGSFWKLLHVEPGFDSRQTVTLRPFLPRDAFDDVAGLRRLQQHYEERLAAVPGVLAVGGTQMVPMLQMGYKGGVRLEGRPVPEGEEPGVNWRVVTPGYFAAMGIPLQGGRPLSASDRQDSPAVALVNRAFVERHLTDSEPLGQRLAMPSLEGEHWVEIVGVVGDVRQAGLGRPPRPEIYRPHAQVERPVGMALQVRVAGKPEAFLESLRAAAGEVAPEIPISDLRPMASILEGSTVQQRITAVIFVSFSLLALVLAAAGIYAVVAFETGQRVREIGLRMALGAEPARVLRLVLGHTLARTGAGLGLGLLLAAGAARYTESLLFQVQPFDPWILAGTLATLALVATLAALRPALGAASLDPLEALRQD